LVRDFFELGQAEEKIRVVLDILALVKTKHAVLNKRSNSAKPKSVTFKDEENKLLKPSTYQPAETTQKNSFDEVSERRGSLRREDKFSETVQSSRN